MGCVLGQDAAGVNRKNYLFILPVAKDVVVGGLLGCGQGFQAGQGWVFFEEWGVVHDVAEAFLLGFWEPERNLARRFWPVHLFGRLALGPFGRGAKDSIKAEVLWVVDVERVLLNL